jgi:hypothetical protein
LMASMYEMGVLCVCFVVLMTRKLLLLVSDMTDEVKPMNALRPNFLSVSSEFGFGIASCCRGGAESAGQSARSQLSARRRALGRAMGQRVGDALNS